MNRTVSPKALGQNLSKLSRAKGQDGKLWPLLKVCRDDAGTRSICHCKNKLEEFLVTGYSQHMEYAWYEALTVSVYRAPQRSSIKSY